MFLFVCHLFSFTFHISVCLLPLFILCPSFCFSVTSSHSLSFFLFVISSHSLSIFRLSVTSSNFLSFFSLCLLPLLILFPCFCLSVISSHSPSIILAFLCLCYLFSFSVLSVYLSSLLILCPSFCLSVTVFYLPLSLYPSLLHCIVLFCWVGLSMPSLGGLSGSNRSIPPPPLRVGSLLHAQHLSVPSDSSLSRGQSSDIPAPVHPPSTPPPPPPPPTTIYTIQYPEHFSHCCIPYCSILFYRSLVLALSTYKVAYGHWALSTYSN